MLWAFIAFQIIPPSAYNLEKMR